MNTFEGLNDFMSLDNSPSSPRLSIGAKASSSSDESDDMEATLHTPPPPTSSSRSAALYDAVVSPSDASSGTTFQLEDGSNSACSSSSSCSSSSFLQGDSVGDVSASTTAAVVGSEGYSSCNDDQVQIEAVSPSPMDWTSIDRCPYYPPRSDGCTEPRSCRDCLNIDVGGGYSCMVNQYGRCVQKSMSTYIKALDFKYQISSNDGEVHEEQKVQFPADIVDYCPYGDKLCKQCKDTVFADVIQGRINGSLTKFCFGEGGCVCIAVCEAPIWKTTIGQTVCNGSVVNKDYESQHANAYEGSTADSHNGHGTPLVNLMMEIVGGVAAAVMLIAAVMYVRKRRRAASDEGSGGSNTDSGGAEGGRSQEGEEGAAGAVSIVVPAPLSLFGWQAMRSELIEREQLLLAGVEDFSNVRTGYLQLLDVDASAPPPEEDESSAPVLLVPLAGASAPSFSPRDLPSFPVAPSAPLVSPSAPPASPTLLEEELL